MIPFPPKSSFRDWLRSFPQDAVIAEDWDFCRCPLARWLRDDCDISDPYVEPSSSVWAVGDGPTGEIRILPPWARCFGMAIDELSVKKAEEYMTFGPVTAGECLAALAKCPQ